MLAATANSPWRITILHGPRASGPPEERPGRPRSINGEVTVANEFRGNPGECVSWSNGLTTVLLARLAVAAAELCESNWQYEFARWIATYDQNRGPLGCVNFDLIDIPWGETQEEFAVNQRFVVEVAVYAASQEVAYRLPYYPNPDREDFHRESLRAFALMVHHFDRSLFSEPLPTEWKYHFAPTDFVCVQHRLFCHAEGCMVCPDTIHPTPNDTASPGAEQPSCGPTHRGASCPCLQRWRWASDSPVREV